MLQIIYDYIIEILELNKMPISWLNVYNTGIAKIDEQHKKLVQMINDLESAQGKENEAQIIRDIFYRLVDYTHYHFTQEEMLMGEAEYPKTSTHKQQHKILVEEIVKMLEALKTGKLVVGEKLMTMLKDWLITHILGYDKEFGIYYKTSTKVSN